jgi:chemotaxis signal transduction protein
MSEPGSERARRLREEFDGAFAAPLQFQRTAVENVLAIRVAEQPYAVRVAEIAGLLVDRKIVPIPSGSPAFLGLIGYRSSLIPVYDLTAILGFERSVNAPRWILLARRGQELVGFAVQQFERQLQLAMGDLTAIDARDRVTKYIGHLISTGDSVRPVLSISALLETIPGATSIEKER